MPVTFIVLYTDARDIKNTEWQCWVIMLSSKFISNLNTPETCSVSTVHDCTRYYWLYAPLCGVGGQPNQSSKY